MKVVLVGNYLADRQESMIRFADCLCTNLLNRGVEASIIRPSVIVGGLPGSHGGVGKWLGYVDKFILYPRRLRAVALRAGPTTIFHICDHSNAIYVSSLRSRSHLVTCHDLLAVRGAFGDKDAYCEPSMLGGLMQRLILRGLRRASAVVCDSRATERDFARLIPSYAGQLSVVPLGLNWTFQRIPVTTAWSRLSGFNLSAKAPYLLNVGSSLPRKNREGCMLIMRSIAERFSGTLVFAGQPLAESQRALARRLNLDSRIVELSHITGPQLEALYNTAHALLFPSFAEGYGWPILEAQICGCPVICSDRTSIPEVAGNDALIHDVDDVNGFGKSILLLFDPDSRERLVLGGLANASKYTTDRMIDNYLGKYEDLLDTTGRR